MNKLFTILLLLFTFSNIFSQNIGISDDPSFIPSNGLLDIKFLTQSTASNKTGLQIDFSGLSGAGTFTGQKIITPFSYNISFGTSTYAGFFGYHVGIDNGKELRLFNGSYYSSFKSQTQTVNINYTLPAAQGTAKSYLQNDGSGTLSWATPKIARDMLINSGTGYVDAQTIYCGPGSIDGWTVESYAQTRMTTCMITDLRVNVVVNTINSNTTFTLMKNGIATALTLTVGSNATGWFSATGTISFAEGDLADIKIVIPSVAGTQSITPLSITIFYQPQ